MLLVLAGKRSYPAPILVKFAVNRFERSSRQINNLAIYCPYVLHDLVQF